jgi:Na+/proline symporter
VCFFLAVILIAKAANKRSKADIADYFLGGRQMPWWLLGVSMVACTFSADTPNLVTGMVRESGVAKNWAWWAFLITGMTTVFIFAKLWRRTGIMTDLEFYEKRYSGRAAGFLRGFRAVFLGFFFNSLILGSVTLAAIKIGAVMFGISPAVTVTAGMSAAVVYTALGGFRGVVWADFFQYLVAMAGAVAAAVAALNLPEVGGLKNLVTNAEIADKISFIPDFSDPSVWVPMLIIPVAVQWWAVWYPGAEPGGGGYMCQKMLSAKNEKHAVGANLFFNFAHYALRPWPWIIVALASLVVFKTDSPSAMQDAENQLKSPEILPYYSKVLSNPQTLEVPADMREKIIKLHFQKQGLTALHEAFPEVDEKYLKNDAAYPMMVTKTPSGWFGLIIASLIAAYMSTIATHLNWGASYLVNDFYKRFVNPEADGKKLRRIAVLCTVMLAFTGGLLSLTIMDNATQAFDILLLSGAGTGAVYLLRWFWWRINAATEIAAMAGAFVMSLVMVFVVPEGCLSCGVFDHAAMRLLITVAVVTLVWLLTVFLTKSEDRETLLNFYRLTSPGGPGWKHFLKQFNDDSLLKVNAANWQMPLQLLCVFVGIVTVYALLFAGGFFVYLKWIPAVFLTLVGIAGAILLFKLSGKLKLTEKE